MIMANNKLRIGTRGSPLALTQANLVIDALKHVHPNLKEKSAIEMIVIKTTGDRIQSTLLSEVGGKGLFTKEIDEAMLNDRIDIGIHSMKDMPTILPDGIVFHTIMAREDARDAFISDKATSIEDLAQGSSIGTASLRRKSQLLSYRPDLTVLPIRGNVDTRLQKIKEGIIDATLLAYAGLKRLGKDREIKQLIDTKVILPAVGQGALAATCRGDDAYANTVLALLSEPTTTAAIVAERAMLAVLDGSCHTPIGGLAQPDGQGHLELRGLVALPDGAKTAEVTMTAPITKAEDLGKSVGENLLIKAGPDILNFLEEGKPLFVRPHPEAE